nr:hypothetical protein [Halorussus sp. MSC15.2]
MVRTDHDVGVVRGRSHPAEDLVGALVRPAERLAVVEVVEDGVGLLDLHDRDPPVVLGQQVLGGLPAHPNQVERTPLLVVAVLAGLGLGVDSVLFADGLGEFVPDALGIARVLLVGEIPRDEDALDGFGGVRDRDVQHDDGFRYRGQIVPDGRFPDVVARDQHVVAWVAVGVVEEAVGAVMARVGPGVHRRPRAPGPRREGRFQRCLDPRFAQRREVGQRRLEGVEVVEVQRIEAEDDGVVVARHRSPAVGFSATALGRSMRSRRIVVGRLGRRHRTVNESSSL